MYLRFIPLPSLLAFILLSFRAMAAAEGPCPSAAQTAKIKEIVARSPGALPNALAEKAGIPESVFVAGLEPKTAIGTTGESFARIWASLSAWERPAFLVPLDKNNTLEVFGRIGPSINEKNGSILIESPGSGVGGHFKPSSIASIYMIRIPDGETKTVYGMLFFNEQSETLLGIYSVSAPHPAVFALLSPDAYQKTWDLIAEQPHVCAR